MAIMGKNQNVNFSKPFHGRILISWNPILGTFLCTKIEKFTMDNFFLLMHVLVPCVPDSLLPDLLLPDLLLPDPMFTDDKSLNF